MKSVKENYENDRKHSDASATRSASEQTYDKDNETESYNATGGQKYKATSTGTAGVIKRRSK